MRPLNWLAVGLLTLALVGCQPKAQIIGGVPRQKSFKKVVSLCPGTTEIIASNGSSQVLVGRSASDNYPTSVSAVPVVCNVKPDYEKLTILKPDLVVYDASLYSEADVAKIKALGAEAYVFKANTIEDFKKELYGLSTLLCIETSIDSYVGRIDAQVAAAKNDKVTDVKVAILMGGGGTYLAAGTDSLQADAVKVSGATLVGPKADRFVPVNPEMLVTQGVDVIILPTSKGTADKDVASVLADPKLRALKAVQSKKIVAINSDVVLRRGNRIDTLVKSIHDGLAIRLK